MKFRRQHPVGPYFADFACLEIGLIVELDGGQHTEAAAISYDNLRTEALVSAGFRVLRFWNNDVLAKTDDVVQQIFQVAQTLTPTLSRKREREQRDSD